MAREKITQPPTDPTTPERSGDTPTIALHLGANAHLTDLSGSKAAWGEDGVCRISATLKVDADVSPSADLGALPLSAAVRAQLEFHQQQPEMARNEGGIWFRLGFRPLRITLAKGKTAATFLGDLNGRQQYGFSARALQSLRLVINADLTVEEWAALGGLIEQDGVSLVVEDPQGSLELVEGGSKRAAR